jgi:hypothetical protein
MFISHRAAGIPPAASDSKLDGRLAWFMSQWNIDSCDISRAISQTGQRGH